jgi:hypothetical protein
VVLTLFLWENTVENTVKSRCHDEPVGIRPTEKNKWLKGITASIDNGASIINKTIGEGGLTPLIADFFNGIDPKRSAFLMG